jgi:membrane protease YdiL (CAAX protease family)
VTALRLVRPTVAAPRTAVVVMAAGCAVLTGRPLLLDATGVGPAPLFGTLFLILLAVSLVWPVPGDRLEAQPPSPVIPVLALGVGAFLAGRILLAGSPSPAPAIALVIALNTLAAFSEEAFFRRFIYGVLLAGGPVLAVGGSAVLFAAVHVAVYGLWVLPLDLAAGLLFGWQRRATGSWMVPAVTHAVANLMVVL